MVAGGVTIAVFVIGVITIGLGFAANYLIEAADKKLGKMATGDSKNTDGLSAVLAPMLRDAGKQIEKSWNHLMTKFPVDYMELTF